MHAVHLTVLIVLIGMYRAIARIALGPDEHQQILSILVLVYCACELAGRIGRFAVDLQDDISRLDARIFGWTARTNILDQDAMHLLRHIELLPRFRREIGHLKADLSVRLTLLAVIVSNFSIAVELAYGEVQCSRLAIA